MTTITDQAKRAIAYRDQFREIWSGLRGVWAGAVCNEVRTIQTQGLPEDWADMLRQNSDRPTYVVYSSMAPIAWWTATSGWVIPDVEDDAADRYRTAVISLLHSWAPEDTQDGLTERETVLLAGEDETLYPAWMTEAPDGSNPEREGR